MAHKSIVHCKFLLQHMRHCKFLLQEMTDDYQARHFTMTGERVCKNGSPRRAVARRGIRLARLPHVICPAAPPCCCGLRSVRWHTVGNHEVWRVSGGVRPWCDEGVCTGDGGLGGVSAIRSEQDLIEHRVAESGTRVLPGCITERRLR
jgi:hypothetical protein